MADIDEIDPIFDLLQEVNREVNTIGSKVDKILVIFMLVVVYNKRIYVLTWSYQAIYRGCIECIWVVS